MCDWNEYRHIFGNLSHCSSKIEPSAPGVVQLTIIKVENLPNMDADEFVGGLPKPGTTDPFVRIRLKEIDTGKVFIHINYHVLVYYILFVFMTKCTPKFLDNFEQETSVLLDLTTAYFLESFNFGHVRVHLLILSFFCSWIFGRHLLAPQSRRPIQQWRIIITRCPMQIIAATTLWHRDAPGSVG